MRLLNHKLIQLGVVATGDQTMSAKNKLQERFQKRNRPIPRYHTRQIGGPSHDPIWVSEVELDSGEPITGDQAKSKVQAEQSAAEKALATIRARKKNPVLPERRPLPIEGLFFVRPPRPIERDPERGLSLEEPIISEKGLTFEPFVRTQVISGRGPEKGLKTQLISGRGPMTCLLIDGENLPNLAKSASSLSCLNLDLYLFVGYHHHLCERDYGPNIQKILVPTTHANGVDSCMQLYVGTFLLTKEYEEYWIGTRDHFGSALVDLIQAEGMAWRSRKARLVTTEKQLKQLLV